MKPENAIAYALQLPIDQAINRLKTNAKLSSKTKIELQKYIKQELEIIRVISDVQEKLKIYQERTNNMVAESRLKDNHDSKRLGLHMRAMGLPKPGPRWDAHAIISGSHNEADVLRAILALSSIGIDDPDNGAWLPKAERDRIGTPFPNAVAHAKIHRWHYYRWLDEAITFDLTEAEIRRVLLDVRFKLQTSTFKPSVMKKKSET